MKTFEEKLRKIKDIADELESGRLSLDKSIEKFEEGTKLIKECHENLTEIKQKITVLIEDSEGNVTEEEYNADEEE